MRDWSTMGLLVALLLASLALFPAPARGAALELSECSVAGTREAARCGEIQVYENREGRTGRKIPIRIVVFPAKTAPPAPDPLFVIAGGPGQSATEFAGLLIRDFAFAHERRDVVFVDQRGTGGSNALHCSLGRSFDDIIQSVALGVDANLEAVADCRQELEKRADLRFYTTPLAMDDLDDVRAALGYGQINVFAASYGTRAALVYMRQHPRRVRSAILRALASVDLKLPVTVAADAERALNRLLGACSADEACRDAFGDVEQSLRTVLARLRKTPVIVKAVDPRTKSTHDVRVDHNVFGTTLFFLMFATEWSKEIPRIVHAAERGDYAPLAAWLPVNVLTAVPVHWGMRRSVLCSEDVTLITEGEVKGAGVDTLVGDTANLGLLASCRQWPVGQLPIGYFEPIKTTVPILAISGVEDPVVPPHRSEHALHWLPNATHLVVPGTAHGPNFPGCVRDLSKEFLEAGSGEKLDTSCLLKIRRPPFTTPN